MRTWPLQSVTMHGEQAAGVVVSVREFDALIKPRLSLADFLLAGTEEAWPDDGVDAINDRSSDPGRDIDL